MSNTEMYFIGSGTIDQVDIKNAWLGAMYVWNDISKRYFKLDGFPTFGIDKHMKIWNSWSDESLNIPVHEAAALLSTMDGALVRKDEFKIFSRLLKSYGEENPGSSFSRQAEIIEGNSKGESTHLAWNQMSVVFSRWYDYDEDDNLIISDPESVDKAFFIVDNLREIYGDIEDLSN